jgi:prenyl protein peptidase
VAVGLLVNAFVGSLYALPRRVRDLPRNDPTHVAWRIAAVSVVCLLAPLAFAVAMYAMDAQRPWGFHQLLGAAPRCNGLHAVGTCVVAMQALFLGPAVDAVVELFARRREGPWPRGTCAWDARSLRDFVVAPFAEEWVFRFINLPIFLAAGYTLVGALAQTAVWFGLAHVHHFRDLRSRGITSQRALVTIAVQLTYTSVFAWLCGHFAAHTGSLLGAVAMHSLANFYGLPRVDFLQDLARGRRVGCNVALLAVYCAGVAAFVAAWRYVASTPFPCAMVQAP